MQDFPDHRYTSSCDEAGPEILPNVLDGIYPQGVNLVGLDQVVHPTIEGIDHMGILGIEIGKSFCQPAWSSALTSVKIRDDRHCSDCR